MSEMKNKDIESSNEDSMKLTDQELNKVYRDRKISLPHKSQIRNLRQYKDLTDEQFEEKFTKEYLGLEPERQWENRIQIKIKEIGEDYNLDDLKINDKYTLRALAAAIIRLEDWDSVLGKLMLKMDDQVMLKIDKISSIQSSLRGDISKMQDDLKISRKSRRSEKEEDAITFMEDLKVKAKKFYEQKMMYVFCPKCNTLLSTMWFLYPQFKTNMIKLKCHRDLGDGLVCDGEVNITSEWLLNNGMRNKKDIPESVR